MDYHSDGSSWQNKIVQYTVYEECIVHSSYTLWGLYLYCILRLTTCQQTGISLFLLVFPLLMYFKTFTFQAIGRELNGNSPVGYT